MTDIEVFTDGSCHTQFKIGAWASIIIDGQMQKQISGTCTETTHNRMELLAIIESIRYIKKNMVNFGQIQIFTDSQYAVGIPERYDKILQKDFRTSKGNIIQNHDLVQNLILEMQNIEIKLIKVKAHQKKGESVNLNRTADKLVRKILREKVRQNTDLEN